MNRSRLMRIKYATDFDPAAPDYPGNFSEYFPTPIRGGRTLVSVDWSEQGFVSVTWLVSA